MMRLNIGCYPAKDHLVFGRWFPKKELTRGVVITYVDDLLLTGWQHHIDAITKALLAKYVMKMSGVLPEGKPEGEEYQMGLTFWELESLGMMMALCGAINLSTFSTA